MSYFSLQPQPSPFSLPLCFIFLLFNLRSFSSHSFIPLSLTFGFVPYSLILAALEISFASTKPTAHRNPTQPISFRLPRPGGTPLCAHHLGDLPANCLRWNFRAEIAPRVSRTSIPRPLILFLFSKGFNQS